MRAVFKLVLMQCRLDGKEACGNMQLCASLEAGIEGNLHAVRAFWLESAGWVFDEGMVEEQTPFSN